MINPELPTDLIGADDVLQILRTRRADVVNTYEHEGKVWRYDAVYGRQQVTFAVILIELPDQPDAWRIAPMAMDISRGKQITKDEAVSRFS